MKALGYLQVDRFRIDRGHEWVDERHAWRFIRVAKGNCYWISRESKMLEPREVIVLPPLARGLLRASQVSEVVFQGFCFDPTLLTGFFTFSERYQIKCLSFDCRSSMFLPPSHAVSEKFETVTMFGASRGPMARRAETLELVALFFDELLRRSKNPVATQTCAVERFQKLISHLPDVEIARLSPVHLADLCGCSPGHLNRLFKRHFGVPLRARKSAFGNLRLE